MLIEQTSWSEYLAELSRQAEGYEVTVELLIPDLGDQVEVRSARLAELAFDAREGIAVAVSDPEGHEELLRHVISGPVRVEATDEPGVPGALLVEDESGTKTLVRLAAPTD
jgi:hypothetical protein